MKYLAVSLIYISFLALCCLIVYYTYLGFILLIFLVPIGLLCIHHVTEDWFKNEVNQ